MRTALEDMLVATVIMLFSELWSERFPDYLNISEATSKIASGFILFLVALDILAAKRQARKRAQRIGNAWPDSDTAGEGEGDGEKGLESDNDNVAIHLLVIPLLASPYQSLDHHVSDRCHRRFRRQHQWYDHSLFPADCGDVHNQGHSVRRRGGQNMD